MKILLLSISLIFTSIAAQAGTVSIVCEEKSPNNHIRVEISDKKSIISGSNLRKPVTINKLEWVWDGHATGLVTGAGFSMKYRNEYGCIKDVVITTGFIDRGAGQTIETKNFDYCRDESPTGNKWCPH